MRSEREHDQHRGSQDSQESQRPVRVRESSASVGAGPLTALQLQRLLDRAGLSQRGAAKALEINERTMRKYVSGDSKVPKTVELALLYLAS